MDPIRLAEQLGTLNVPDRSRQYSRSSPEEQLRSLNELWKAKRILETAIKDRDKQIAGLHSRVEERDKLIAHQAVYLKIKDMKFWIVRFALGGLVVGQWGLIGWLGTELLDRLH
jgi:hypothetical protein